MKINEERSFLFVNKQGGKSSCHKSLMKAENYTVKKEKYWFEASVMLPAPSGRCRRLVKKCFPTVTKEKLKVSLGHANCYGGKMPLIEGIA